MSTIYVSNDIKLNEYYSIYVDGNSKSTADNGSYENPKANVLSLPHISTCPGATKNCLKTCYVFGLQKAAPLIYEKYIENERTIHAVLLDNNLRKLFVDNLSNYINNNLISFRWHTSGDIFNEEYAILIKEVVLRTPTIKHWLYTRSLSCVKHLVNINNLIVNISTDDQTYFEAKQIATQYNLRLCYLTLNGIIPEDLPDNSIIFPDYSLRGRELDKPTTHSWWQNLSQRHRKMICPADFFGQSEKYRCGVCKKCF